MFDTATKQNRNSLETALDASVAHVYNFLKYSSNILSRKTWQFDLKQEMRESRKKKEETALILIKLVKKKVYN